MLKSRLSSRLAALPLLLCAACYEYLPVSRAAAARDGVPVRLTLTDSGAVVLASRIGPAVEQIEGRVLGDTLDSYVVSVEQTRTRSGAAMEWRGERVTIAHPLVADVMERRFSTSRTLFAGGLALVGLGGVTGALRGSGAGGTSAPVPGNPTNK